MHSNLCEVIEIPKLLLDEDEIWLHTSKLYRRTTSIRIDTRLEEKIEGLKMGYSLSDILNLALKEYIANNLERESS